MTEPLSYRDSGVDLDAARQHTEAIAGLVHGGVTGFAGGIPMPAMRDGVLLACTDGIGTKLLLAQELDRMDGLGQDLVAMCVNDLVVQGAEPLFFLDYFATGKLDVAAARTIIAGIAQGCKEAGCALVGGETAEMPGMYAKGDYDLAGFAVGAVERDEALTGEDVAEGDLVLGLASTGVHSNGFSLVRKVVEKSGVAFDAPAPFAPVMTLGGALLAPTKLYVKSCLAAIRQTGAVKGLAHITGGGFTDNIPRVLPKHLGVRVNLNAVPVLPVFKWLAAEGNIAELELLRTFNCGIGMVAIVKREQLVEVMDVFAQSGETVVDLGEVIETSGDERVIYHGHLNLAD